MTERTGSLVAGGVIPVRLEGSFAMRADHPDTVLARRAAAGDAAAFAALYDRHERRAYNLCYRITGSPDDAADATQETFLKLLERLPGLGDRELNFGSYLLTAARHASYDAIARRRRMTPSDAIPDSALPPVAGADEPALLDAHQEQIRMANEQLPARQREVLALRELEELSYDQVAEIMGMNRNSVAQLISRARLNLRDALRRGALGSIPAASPDCEAALPLLALAQDNGLDDAARADWLATHLTGCATCRVRIEAMEEAGAAYRLWLPLAPALWLRAETAKAAAATTSPAPDASPDPDASAAPDASRLRRLSALAGAGAAVIALAGLVAADIVHAPSRAMRAAAVVSTPTPTPTPTATPRVSPRHRAKPKPRHVEVAVVEPTPVPTTAPTPTPVIPKPKARPRPRPAEITEVPVEVVLPDPEPTATPTPTPEPPPPPPPDPDPDPDPQPPPPRLVCPNCPIVNGQPPSVP
jgi:RNA polymerase sigma factor (sigma-70 family)